MATGMLVQEAMKTVAPKRAAAIKVEDKVRHSR